MKINWKEVASSPGYKSLKKALIRDLGGYGGNWSGRNRKELYKLFNWVICRAKHYAHNQNKSVGQVLNEWEATRDYWWLNHYGEDKQPKLGTGKPRNVKPMGINTILKKDYRPRFFSKSERFHRIRERHSDYAKFQRKRQKGKKPRWSSHRKNEARSYRDRLAKLDK